MAKLLVPLLVLVALGAAAWSTGGREPRADFTFCNDREVSTLDLAQMTWMQDLRVARLLYEGLTRADVMSAGFGPLPGVAERWDISPDALTYTFHLRADARWSNGEPVTAHDFVYAWRRCLLPDHAADYFALFAKIQGGRAFYDWRTARLAEFAKDSSIADRDAAARDLWLATQRRFDELVGVRAVDARTLVVTLERPVPYFLDLTSFPPFYPVHPALVRAHEHLDPATGMVKTRTDWTKPPRLVTNGPFVVTRWRFKRDMRLEANPHWWNRASLSLRTIEIPAIDDPNAGVLAFRTGAIDWMPDVIPQYRGEMLARKQAFHAEHAAEAESLRAQGLDPIEVDRRLPRDPRNTIHVFPAFGTYFYNFNCQARLPDGRVNPFHDPRVRRAFALAVDKDTIAREIRRVGEPVAHTLIPPGSIAGYDGPTGLAHDPELARRLLAEAGFPGGKGFIEVEILFNKDQGHDLIAQSIARDWTRHLGVEVSLRTKELKVFREDLKRGNFMVSRASWFGDYGDPTTFLDISRAADGNNDRKYAGMRFESLLDRAEAERDPRVRLGLLADAERILIEEDLPMIPIFHYVEIHLFDPRRITGISSHPRQTQNLYLVDVLGDGIGRERPVSMRP